jgi:hypothetical protein
MVALSYCVRDLIPLGSLGRENIYEDRYKKNEISGVQHDRTMIQTVGSAISVPESCR